MCLRLHLAFKGPDIFAPMIALCNCTMSGMDCMVFSQESGVGTARAEFPWIPGFESSKLLVYRSAVTDAVLS